MWYVRVDLNRARVIIAHNDVNAPEWKTPSQPALILTRKDRPKPVPCDDHLPRSALCLRPDVCNESVGQLGLGFEHPAVSRTE